MFKEVFQLFTKNWPRPDSPEEVARRAKAAELRLAKLRERAIALGVAADAIDRRSR